MLGGIEVSISNCLSLMCECLYCSNAGRDGGEYIKWPVSLMCECLYNFSAGWDRGEYIKQPVSLLCECLYYFSAGRV